MTAQRVLVSGGAGFLGSHLCERLLLDGCEVICLDNFATGVRENVLHLSDIGPFVLLDHDVTEPFRVEGDIHAVLHFASPASPADYARLPIETLRSGSVGTFNMLDLALEKSARYLLASTSEVYGSPLVHPQPEGYWGNVNPIGPRSVYDEAKRFSEAATMAYRRNHGLETSIIRIFNTYGPRMQVADGRAIPTFIGQALREKPITVSGAGAQTRSLCYVSDLVEGVVRMLNSDCPGPINLGNPNEMTILAVAEAVRVACGSTAPITFVPRPEDDPDQRKPDISLATDLLGWEPKVALADGINDTITWFRDRCTE
ncbi:UDP-glucuronic acid decarboxylase family protein [Streptomyces violascens]|uniref:UDP-glucuronic acid decarboxylase family protein n=1 Tax=Streptomyces violascens TaxID=67381 RepID=UPI00367C2FE2